MPLGGIAFHYPACTGVFWLKMDEIDRLEYPDIRASLLTHEIGLVRKLFLRDSLAGKKLLIKDGKISLYSKELIKVENFIRANLQQHHPYDTRGTIVTYDFGGKRTEKIAFEGSHYFQQLVIASRLTSKHSCKCIFHFSICKEGRSIKFYRPFDFIEDSSDHTFNDGVFLRKRTDINRLNKLYKNLLSLPVYNGSNHSRLLNAVLNIDRAFDTAWLNMKVTLLFIALESLFADTDKSELGYKLAVRVSAFLYSKKAHKAKKIRTYKVIKVGYDLRSKFLHGSKADINSLDKKLSDGRENYSVYFDFPNELSEIVSSVLEKILLSQDLTSLFSVKKDAEVVEYLERLII